MLKCRICLVNVCYGFLPLLTARLCICIYITASSCCVFCSGQVYIASTNHVWRLAPVPITMQIKDLLQNKEFELALQLAVSARIVPSSVNVVRMALQLAEHACLVAGPVNVVE